MTFVEAAVDILRRADAPMHAKDIASRAVAEELLYHVGKSPEQTMSKRLSEAVAMGRGPLVRVAPGVFGLAEWGNRPGRKKVTRREEPAPAKAPAPTKAPAPASAKAPAPTPQVAEPEGQREKTGGRKRRRKKVAKKASPAEQAAPVVPPTVTPVAAPAPVSSPPPVAVSPQGTEVWANRMEELLRGRPSPVQARELASSLRLAAGDALVDALLDADGADRLRNGRSPRFRRYRSGWGLSEKDMPTEIAAMEKAIFDAAARMEAIAERLVAKKVRGLQAPRFFHLAARLLRCMGFSDAEPLSASESEALLRVADRRDSGTAILVLLRRESGNGAINERDVRSFREQVSGRGARRGLLITTGDVSKGAMAEAARAPAISLMGGAALAAEMVRCGIGVERRHAVIPVFDETSF